MKRVISILLVFGIILTLFPLNLVAFAETDEYYEIPNTEFWAKAAVSWDQPVNVDCLFDGKLAYVNNSGFNAGFWAAHDTNGQARRIWIAVDLGRVYDVNAICFEDEGLNDNYAVPTAYTLYYAVDGEDYEAMKGITYRNGSDEHYSTRVNPTLDAWEEIGSFEGSEEPATFDTVTARYLMIYVTVSASTICAIGELHVYSPDEIETIDFEKGAIDRSAWLAKSWKGGGASPVAEVYSGSASASNLPYVMVDMGENVMLNGLVLKREKPDAWFQPDTMDVYVSNSSAAFSSVSSDEWELVGERVENKKSYFKAEFLSRSARYFMFKAHDMGVNCIDNPKDWITLGTPYAYGVQMGEVYEIPNKLFWGKASGSAAADCNIQNLFDGDAGYWQESTTDTQSEGSWIAFDLGQSYSLSKIAFDDVAESDDIALPTDFRVYVSDNADDYKNIMGYTEGGDAGSLVNPDLSKWSLVDDYSFGEFDNIADLGSAEGRYVLIYVTGNADTTLGIGEVHFYSDKAVSGVEYSAGALGKDYWVVDAWAGGDASVLGDSDATTNYGGDVSSDKLPYIMIDLGECAAVEKVILENATPNLWYSPQLTDVYVADDEVAFGDADSESWKKVAEGIEYQGAVAVAEFKKENGRYVMIKAADLGVDMFGNEKSEIYFGEVYVCGEDLAVYYEIPRVYFDVKASRNHNSKLIDTMVLDSQYRYLDSAQEERGYWSPNLDSGQTAGTWFAIDMGANYRICRMVLEDDGFNGNVTVPAHFDVYSTDSVAEFNKLKGCTPGNEATVVNPSLGMWSKIGSYTGGTNSGVAVKFDPRETRCLLIYVTGEASNSMGIGELRVYSDVEQEKIDYSIGALSKKGWKAEAWKRLSNYSANNFIDDDVNTTYSDVSTSAAPAYVMIDMKKEQIIDRVVMQNSFTERWYMPAGINVYTSNNEKCMGDKDSTLWELVAEHVGRHGTVYDVEFIEKPARYIMFKVSDFGVNMNDQTQDWHSLGEVFVYSTGKRTIIPVESLTTDVDYANMICTVSVKPAQALYDGNVGMEAEIFDGGSLIHKETVRYFDKSQNLSFSFEMPELTASDKTYKVCLGGNFDEETTVSIMGTNSLDSSFDGLRGAGDVSALKREMNKILQNFRVDISDISYTKDLENAVYNGLFEKRSTINAANFTEIVLSEIVCRVFELKLSKLITADFAEKYQRVVALDMDKESIFAKLSEKEQKEIIESVCEEFTDIESIERLFANNVELIAFSTLSRGDMDKLIEIYLTSSDSYKDYQKLSDYYKAEVAKALEKASIKMQKDIVNVFEDAVEKCYESKKQTGGSGGGSGGGFISRTPAATDKNSEVQTEQVKKCKFTDISNVLWAKYPIEYLFDKGVINGKTETAFDPNGVVTRGEIIKMLMSLGKNEKTDRVSVFSDVTQNHWAYNYICDAYGIGLATGLGDGRFMPDGSVTRQDVAVFAYRFFKGQGKSFDTEAKVEFVDGDTISDYAKEAVAALSNAGVINGFEDGSFRPNEICSRAMAAKILYELVK